MCDFVGVYEQHVTRVYGFFAYSLGSRLEAEDLTQQTFERALRGWRRYDDSRGSTSSWLLTIARNLLVDHLRAAPPTPAFPLEEAELDTVMTSNDHHRVGPDPELERVIGELGQRERELIALRFGGDLSGEEIARMTGLSVANVQQILSRSLRRMRERLQPATEVATRAEVAR